MPLVASSERTPRVRCCSGKFAPACRPGRGRFGIWSGSQKSKGAPAMALLMGMPKPPSYPSGRYVHTNPLRREAGLRLLTESLPDALHWGIVRAWRRPGLSSSAARELPSAHRQRPAEASLPGTPPRLLAFIGLVELDVARRLVEAPQASIRPATRNALLTEQGAYLRQVYLALAWQIGEAAALAEFQRLVLKVV